ncbi:DnaD domain protein, partial [Limosilactobacillus ingluviei]|uniref:DnaD domain-containing protein n=1 Tax=Limosilactobacillus ingluviei TaxID=148604 RepID=UPI0024B96E2A
LLENSDKSLDIGPEDSFTVGSKTSLSVGSKTSHNIYKTYIEKKNNKREEEAHPQAAEQFPPPFDKLTNSQKMKLSSYQQTMSAELINFEIERVANRQTAPKNPFAYLVAILNDLQAKGITTLDEAMDDHQEEYAQREFEGAIDHGQSKAKPYRRQKKGRKVEQLPAWAADDYQPETGQVTHEEADRLGDLINDVAAKKDTDPDRPQWLDDDVPF